MKLFKDPTTYIFIVLGHIVLLIYLHFVPINIELNYWLIIKLLIIFPILEEYIFRANIQQFLLAKLSNKHTILSIANIITSLIFAISHLFYQELFAIIGIFFASLIFGIIYERHNLSASIIIHSYYNAIFIFN